MISYEIAKFKIWNPINIFYEKLMNMTKKSNL